jgi:hypothetical protein
MNNELKDNSHLLDFSGWYESIVSNNNYSEFGYTILSNEEYLDISKFFDYYLCSPNNLYYCPTRDKTYPITSKTRVAHSYKDLIEGLEKERNHYEKMFLYVIIKPDVQTYKIRFAVFPEIEHKD